MGLAAPPSRRAAAGDLVSGSRTAPRRTAPRACAPGPGSPSCSPGPHAVRRARPRLGPPHCWPARAHALSTQGTGRRLLRPLPLSLLVVCRDPVGLAAPPSRRSAAGDHVSGAWTAPHRPASRARAPGLGSSSRPRDLHAVRRARAPAGPAAPPAGLGSRALHQGDGAETSSSAPALPPCRLQGPRGSRRAAIAPLRGRGPCLRPADRSQLPCVPGPCARAELFEPPT